jgi:3-phenylpropionate/cinnamic acid dioxygenase small subunit
VSLDVNQAGDAADLELGSGVRAFLYREARLADQADYAGWLALWAPGELVYWVAPRADVDPQREVSYIYDNRARLEQRVARWASGFAWAQDPRSKTNRIVGNVEVLDADHSSVQAAANVHVAVSRRGETAMVIEQVGYRLVRGPDGYAIREKKVVFLDGEAAAGNITFVL